MTGDDETERLHRYMIVDRDGKARGWMLCIRVVN